MNVGLDIGYSAVKMIAGDLSPAEHLFLVAQVNRARVMNPLLPLPVAGQEPVIGETTPVDVDAGRLPSGG